MCYSSFIMKDFYSKFEANQFYHIYNRANGNENLFIETKNYDFFLKKWNQYLGNYIRIWAYCLMPNHFHFLIKVKEENQLSKFLKPEKSVNQTISNQFRNLFISYTKSFNKTYNRNGSLFQKPFKHVLIDSQSYLLTLIHYIHHNPIHHHLTTNYTGWKYSSYLAFSKNKATKIDVENVIDLFGNREEFLSFHQQMKDYKKIRHLVIE